MASLASHAPCPVAIIPFGYARRATDRLVVEVDGSPSGAAALAWTKAEAALTGSVVRVIEIGCDRTRNLPPLAPDELVVVGLPAPRLRRGPLAARKLHSDLHLGHHPVVLVPAHSQD
jgi:nucleotide-binding universal stress UspA family protein